MGLNTDSSFTKTTVLTTAVVSGALNFIAATSSALSTGCIPHDESTRANKKQNSIHELQYHFKQLYFRLINRYYADKSNQKDVTLLAKKIHKNISGIINEISKKTGEKAGKKILEDFIWTINFLQSDTDEDKKTLLRQCPNQDLEERLYTRQLISSLKLC